MLPYASEISPNLVVHVKSKAAALVSTFYICWPKAAHDKNGRLTPPPPIKNTYQDFFHNFQVDAKLLIICLHAWCSELVWLYLVALAIFRFGSFVD